MRSAAYDEARTRLAAANPPMLDDDIVDDVLWDIATDGEWDLTGAQILRRCLQAGA